MVVEVPRSFIDVCRGAARLEAPTAEPNRVTSTRSPPWPRAARVRLESAVALGKVKVATEPVAAALRDARQDHDPSVRKAVNAALKKLKL